MSFQLGRSRSCISVLLLLLHVSLLSSCSSSAAVATATAMKTVATAAIHHLHRHDHHAYGSIGNELAGVEEWALESEIVRRLLQSSNSHISYGALKQDKPAGSSKPGQPYTRGCEKIYNCRA